MNDDVPTGQARMKQDEEPLLQRLREGERTAFETVVSRHYSAVWRQQYFLCGDADLAADLTQETFIEAWRSLAGFKGRSTLRTWLYTIAARVWRRKVLSRCQPKWEPLPDTLVSELPEPEAAALHLVQEETIARALQKLPADLRAVLVLHYRQEMTHSEIADALSLPLGTVKTRLYEGLRRLRKMLTVPQEAK
jgi:RNA polymerase sigma-70 factor, ECF subfamily